MNQLRRGELDSVVVMDSMATVYRDRGYSIGGGAEMDTCCADDFFGGSKGGIKFKPPTTP